MLDIEHLSPSVPDLSTGSHMVVQSRGLTKHGTSHAAWLLPRYSIAVVSTITGVFLLSIHSSTHCCMPDLAGLGCEEQQDTVRVQVR